MQVTSYTVKVGSRNSQPSSKEKPTGSVNLAFNRWKEMRHSPENHEVRNTLVNQKAPGADGKETSEKTCNMQRLLFLSTKRVDQSAK